MGWHPVNLALRFVLEIVALAAYGLWGVQQASGAARYALGIGLMVLMGVLWGTFRVPGDASGNRAAPVAVPGALRLALELLLFAGAALALYDAGYESAAVVFAAASAAHYVVSYDRIAWLLRH